MKSDTEELPSECHPDVEKIAGAVKQLHSLVNDIELTVDVDSISDSIDIANAHKNLRHDLRTPMNAIKGYSELLLEDISSGSFEKSQNGFKYLLTQSDLIISKIDILSQSPSTTDDHTVKLSNTKVSTLNHTQPGHILVVDDLAANREVLRKRLLYQGHTVECVSGGEQALEMLHESNFDLVLLDMIMPDMDGYEVLSRIKSDTQLKHVPVIVVSALNEMQSVIRCIEAGAEDYLSKPFDATLLKARIGTSLETKRLRDKTAALVNRLEGELEDAKRAQLSMVPHEFPRPTLPRPVTIQGYMQPAREVGGDFYDFFYTGEKHLWLMVGDVSDKGVASGMFMARTVALIRFITNYLFDQTESLLTPHEVLNRLNSELCDFNPDMTFVTILLVRMNIQTGELLTSNAGHSAPCVLSPASPLEHLETIIGPPLGIRQNSTYKTHAAGLSSGQQLFLYTDGITDAQNENGDLFSEERMFKSLNDLENMPPLDIIQGVRNDIEAFVNDAPQFDDITMLAVRWDGDDMLAKKNLSLANSLSEISQTTQEILCFCLEQGVPTTESNDLAVVVDEVLSNIINYAYSGSYDHIIAIEITVTNSSVTLVFSDDGIAFNPLIQTTPHTDKPIAEREIGGLGIHFVLNLVDESSYHRKDSKNRLTLMKQTTQKHDT